MASSEDASLLTYTFHETAYLIEEAIQHCVNDSQETGRSMIPDALVKDKWLISVGQWALKKLRAYETLRLWYKLERQHISLEMISCCAEGHAKCLRIERPETLEEALTKMSHHIQNGTRRMLITGCKGYGDDQQANKGSPKTLARRINIPRNIHLLAKPTSEAAIIAFLFVFRGFFAVDLDSLYDLLNAIRPHLEYDDDELTLSSLTSVRRDECESLNDFSLMPPGMPDPVAQSSPSPSQPRSSTTKILKFPSPFPTMETEYLYMERHQPHATQPTPTLFSMFGSNYNESKNWVALSLSSNPELMKAYRSRITKLLLSQEDDEARRKQLTDWTECVHHLYHVGLDHAQKILCDGMRQMNNFKFQGFKAPRTGAAHIYLTYMNHLEFQNSLVNLLQKNLSVFPPQWNLSRTTWVKEIRSNCKALAKNNRTLHKEAVKVRALVIEQHTLSQASSLGFLTTLASFFVPISAVASVFGMNTREINDSAWPIRYFITAAVPLTIVSVLLPLIALTIFRETVAIFAPIAPIARFKWIALFVSFAVNLACDVGAYTEGVQRDLLLGISTTTSMVLALIWGFLYYRRHNTVERSALSGSFRDLSYLGIWLFWLLDFFSYAILSVLVASGGYIPFINLIPFVLYFSFVAARLAGRRLRRICTKEKVDDSPTQ
ncbi:hypothetical protein F5Y18DRAFT_372484 [Xylariaceae sp. FL1019]|nr:hypothetical protein F5Y18DRAFT_372484 [Xylariaceae sp. FL1019]